jgi:hypothetical protein
MTEQKTIEFKDFQEAAGYLDAEDKKAGQAFQNVAGVVQSITGMRWDQPVRAIDLVRLVPKIVEAMGKK